MVDFKESSFVLSRSSLRRSSLPRVRPHVSIQTLDPTAILPKAIKSVARNRSEPHSQKPKLTPRRTCKLPLDSESLAIQSSQMTLLQISQVLTMRDKVSRSPQVLEKYSRNVNSPCRILETSGEEATRKITSLNPESRAESRDSNECEIDLGKFIGSAKKRTVNLKEIKIEDVFHHRFRERTSPLTSINKAFSRGFERRSPVTVSRNFSPNNLLQTMRKLTPKPSSSYLGDSLALKGLQLCRLSVEKNMNNRIRWIQKHKVKLKHLGD